MLSIKRVGVTILITILISILILVYTVGDNKITNINIENNIPVSTQLMQSDISAFEMEYNFLLVGDDNAITTNISTLFEMQKLQFTKKSKIVQQDLIDVDVVIFCNDVVSENIDLQVLGNYIDEGGKIILASGLPESYQDSYLNPYLGIVEKSIKESCSKFTVVDNFLPYGETDMVYSEFNASTWVSLQPDAEVYMYSEELESPIVYSYTYGQGEAMVINATFLQDKDSVGILVAAIGEMLNDFIYPIMGSKLIFIDNIPVASEYNDSESLMLYGRDTEQFVLDKIWPLFQTMGLKHNIKYTTGILTAANYEDILPLNSESLFYSIGKSTLQYEGELVFAGNFLGEDEIIFNTEFTDSFYEIFNNYEINGFAVQAGNMGSEMFAQIKEEYPDVNITIGNINDNPQDNSTSLIEKNNDNYNLPIMSEGFDFDDKTSWNMVANMAAYGLISHKFDVNSLMGFSWMETTWEENKEMLSYFEEKVYEPLHWLEPVTLSQSQKYIDGYLSLDYRWEKNDNVIEMNCTNLLENQAFLLRTDKTIKEVEGGSFEKINDNYYLIKLFDTNAFIRLEE